MTPPRVSSPLPLQPPSPPHRASTSAALSLATSLLCWRWVNCFFALSSSFTVSSSSACAFCSCSMLWEGDVSLGTHPHCPHPVPGRGCALSPYLFEHPLLGQAGGLGGLSGEAAVALGGVDAGLPGIRGPLDDALPDSEDAPAGMRAGDQPHRGAPVLLGMPKKQQNPPLPSPLSSAPHPWGHPTHGCIPEAPKSWPAFAISNLGGPCINPCPLSPSPCSSPGVTGIAAAPLPVPLHELAGQPLQGLRTDPLSPLLPRRAPRHPATHPGGESRSPGAGCPPCGCPRGGAGWGQKAARAGKGGKGWPQGSATGCGG